MKIHLLRHGQTDSNLLKKMMGQKIDEGLNETGRRQVEQTAQALVGYEFDLILSSTLKRAKETAEIISGIISRPVEFTPDLVERDGGSLSGMLWSEIENSFGFGLSKFETMADFDFTPFGGESIQSVRERVKKFFEYVVKYSDKKVLVVTHGGIIKVMHAIRPQTGAPAYIPLKNSALIEFEL